jgi:hypothetical protein
VLGHEFVGRVAALGEEVTSSSVGHRVVSGAGISCAYCVSCLRARTNLCAEYHTLGLQVDGGQAEYVTSPASPAKAASAFRGRLLTLRDEDVAVLPPDRRAEFIREATRLVGNIRASVFSAMVKKEAEALSSGGWEIKKTPRGWRRSEVLIARDGARARLVPVWATTPGPKATERITQAKDRIERTRLPEHTDRDIIVVPPRPRAPSDRAATPSIVRLDELSAALA